MCEPSIKLIRSILLSLSLILNNFPLAKYFVFLNIKTKEYQHCKVYGYPQHHTHNGWIFFKMLCLIVIGIFHFCMLVKIKKRSYRNKDNNKIAELFLPFSLITKRLYALCRIPVLYAWFWLEYTKNTLNSFGKALTEFSSLDSHEVRSLIALICSL